jgi:hypothetical protein
MRFTVPCQITISAKSPELAKEIVSRWIQYHRLFDKDASFKLGEPVPEEDTKDGSQDRSSESSLQSKGN